MSGKLQNSSDGGGQARPRFRLHGELLAAGVGEFVKASAASQLGNAPRGGNPPLVFQAVQRGVKRPLIHAEHVLRDLLDALGDGPAMLGAGLQGAEDEEVQRALEE